MIYLKKSLIIWTIGISLEIGETRHLLISWYTNIKKPSYEGSCLDLVPTPRIELGAEHYHCSVLPLNYVGVCLFIILKKNKLCKSKVIE